MKRFSIREVETLKTTAAFYDCGCAGQPECPCIYYADGRIICGEQ